MKKYRVLVNGVSYEVELEAMDSETAAKTAPVPAQAPAVAPAPVSNGTQAINAPMPGTILDVRVQAGQAVKNGDVLFILEAMKMENEILAPADGTVQSVNVTKGQAVESGAPLCTIA